MWCISLLILACNANYKLKFSKHITVMKRKRKNKNKRISHRKDLIVDTEKLCSCNLYYTGMVYHMH